MIPPPVIGAVTRNYVGWILLAAIGLPLLVLVNLNFFSTAYSPDSRARACATELKSAVRLGRYGVDGTSKWKDVDACVDGVAAERSKDTMSAMVYAASRYEEGRTVQPSDVAVLAKSKYARHRAFAAVYGEPKLSQRRAESLAAAMPDTSIVYSLAKVHALRKAGIPGGRRRFLGGTGLAPASIAEAVLLVFAALLGLGLWVAYIGLRIAGLLKPRGHPLGALGLGDADRCAVRAAQYLLLYIVASVVMAFAEHFARMLGLPAPSSAASLVMHSVLLAIGFIALTFLPLDGRRISLADIGITRDRVWRNVAWGVGGEMANVPVMLFLGVASEWMFRGIPLVENPVTATARFTTDPVTLVLLLIGAAVLAPFIEETWFRGTLLPAFSAVGRKPAWGIAVTSILFASLHPTGLPSWLPLASIGAMGAMLTYQTRSLVPAMVMHGVHNAVTLAFTVWGT